MSKKRSTERAHLRQPAGRGARRSLRRLVIAIVLALLVTVSGVPSRGPSPPELLASGTTQLGRLSDVASLAELENRGVSLGLLEHPSGTSRIT